MRQLTALLSSRFASTVVYRVVYANDAGAVTELQIRQLAAGYSVHRFNVNDSGEVLEAALVSGAPLEVAKDYVREESCCLEQIGFDWLEEPQVFELEDFSNYTLSCRTPVCVTSQSFFHSSHNEAGEYLSQSLPGGIRLILQCDGNGKVLIRPSINAEPIILNDELEAQARALFAFNGFRGALLDVVIHNHNLYIVDAMYFGNTWVDELPVSSRIRFLLETMKKHGIKSDCVIRPVTVNPADWLMVHDHALTRGIVVRRNASLPVCSRTDVAEQGASEQHTYLLSQQSHIQATLLKALGSKMMIRHEDDFSIEPIGALPYYYNFNDQKVSILAKGSEPLMAF